jgi:hypothetical protein
MNQSPGVILSDSVESRWPVALDPSLALRMTNVRGRVGRPNQQATLAVAPTFHV